MRARNRVLEALQGHGCAVRGNSAQCPAHEDRSPSLSIGQRKDGNGVVLTCHTGCDTEDVVAALGLTMADLFDEPLPKPDPHQARRKVAEYPYTDEQGELLFRVERWEPGKNGKRKDFIQRAADGGYKTKGIRRVLYRLPEVAATAQAGGVVIVCEGEKDAESLAAIGACATTMPGGVGMGWRDDYTASLRGAAEVVIIADRDQAGINHARKVAASLTRFGVPHRIALPATSHAKADISDHLAAGYGFDDLIPLDESTSDATEPPPETEEPPKEPTASENPTQVRLAQLRAALVDSDGLDGIPDPVPLIDGILYRDSLAWLYGKPGSAKSFVALDWAGCIGSGIPWQYRGAAQGPVLYLVAEGVSGVRRRVRAWEEAFRVPMKNVTFLPIAVQLLHGTDLTALTILIAEIQPSMVVVDTQARVTVGADENSNGEMSKVVHAADQIRQACGACVLMVHHSGKNGLDLRGASAFEGAATSIVKVTKDGEYVEVHSDKQKDVEDFDTIFLRLTPVGSSAVLMSRSVVPGSDEMNRTEQTLLDTMRDSFGTTSTTAKTLIDVTGLPKTSVYRALTALVKRGALRNIGTEKRPLYALPAAPPGAA